MDTRSCDRGVQQLVACIFVSEFVNSSLRGIPNVYCIYVLLRFFFFIFTERFTKSL